MKLYFQNFSVSSLCTVFCLFCFVMLFVNCKSRSEDTGKNMPEGRNIETCYYDVIYEELKPNELGVPGVIFKMKAEDDQLYKAIKNNEVERILFWDKADKSAADSTATGDIRTTCKARNWKGNTYELVWATTDYMPIPTRFSKNYSNTPPFNKDSLMLNSLIRIIDKNGRVWNIKSCATSE
ncbi:hypothetical protein [Pontibacter populi]|uniref:Lipoprotein n=1 Tax=Pontibacter populi TaxID=890055 RepID=A0ABV1RPR7_9BACT